MALESELYSGLGEFIRKNMRKFVWNPDNPPSVNWIMSPFKAAFAPLALVGYSWNGFCGLTRADGQNQGRTMYRYIEDDCDEP